MANNKISKTNYYVQMLEKYGYCESKRISSPIPMEKEKYSNIIQDFITNKKNSKFNKDIDFELMEVINWIALWKINRIIELKNPPSTNLASISNQLSEFKKMKKADYTTINNLLDELLSSTKEGKGVDLPMASTILNFFNSNLCPILDVRADRAIFSKCDDLREQGFSILDPNNDPRITSGINALPSKKNKKWKKQYYLVYLKRCENFIKDNKSNVIKMDTIDKFLYQFDKYPNPNNTKLKNSIGNYKIGQWI